MAEADIILSGATVKYAPVAEAFPDETTVAYGAAWGGNWVELGTLERPLAMNYTQGRGDADVQNALTPVKDFIISETIILRSALSEVTGDNLALLTHGTNTDTAAGGSQKPYSRVQGGGNPIVSQYAVGFEGWRADTTGAQQPVRFFFFKSSFMFENGLSLSKTERVSVPFSIKIYADTSKAIGLQLFEWQIVTGPTS